MATASDVGVSTTVVTPSSAPPRSGALDGLRGVAVLSVMAYHLVWAAPEIAAPPFAQGGWVGVDVFFVLSGFLIGGLLLAEMDRTATIDLPAFFGRRLLRLYPAMVAFLVAVTTFTVIVDHVPLRRLVPSLQAAFLYYLNVPLSHNHYLFPTIVHLWTLSVEFHFYLLLPPLLLILRATRARWAWAGTLTILGAAVAVNRSRAWNDHSSFLGPYVSTFTRLDALLAGVLLALFRHQGWLRAARSAGSRRWPISPAAVLAAAGAGWLGFVVWTTPTDQAWLYHWGMVVDTAAATAVVWFLVAAPGAGVARFLASPLPRWLGERSYALYLCHYAVFVAVQQHLPDLGPWPRVFVGPAIALAIAEVSYRLVESPALRLKSRLSRAGP